MDSFSLTTFDTSESKYYFIGQNASKEELCTLFVEVQSLECVCTEQRSVDVHVM